jgi:uncharacterized DUF497 family protein
LWLLELEWDEAKRLKALYERGVDFADVVGFDQASLQTFADLRFEYGEPRFNTYGYLDGTLCTYCWTPRGGRTRIISMRRANDRERKAYEARTKRRDA